MAARFGVVGGEVRRENGEPQPKMNINLTLMDHLRVAVRLRMTKEK